MNSFLRVFKSILHAVESAALIIAPIVKAVDPTIGALMTQATNTAIGIESAITASGAGSQKSGVVEASTQATVDLINSLLASQGKQPLPSNIAQAVVQTAKTAVDSLNTVANTVSPIPPA